MCRLEPTSLFPAKNQTSPSAYVEIFYGMGVTYTQIRTLMLSTHCSGNQLSDCLKKTTSSWQKGRESAVNLGYGMIVLVASEEERGEVDTYMVLSSYYYDMLAINDTTQHMTQKKTTPHDVGDVSAVSGHCVGKTRRHVFKTNFWRHRKYQNLQLSHPGDVTVNDSGWAVHISIFINTTLSDPSLIHFLECLHENSGCHGCIWCCSKQHRNLLPVDR